ncbi:zinc-dependent metalloprotease [Rhodococcus chondri]|uniref:Zinc-dependent metalloprotease n=1 Tax=Rhodococcus chondri TaxID=3065941 RepID=A0ABU7JY65_9NOCA|nr:zinc-dependent metalloprotease [Rhodococcus sp. CC-R104]MEE2034950.1 zinc-dependent metalloprotease [Rhodococcus sp. CC-R104]
MTRAERALGDAIDWGFAAGVGARLARPGPAMSRYTHDAVVAELASASERSEGPVRELTKLDGGHGSPRAALVVDRPGWVHAAASSMADLTGAGDSGLWLGKPAGAQAGAMLAYLSSAVLGQYDPFSRTLLLVAPNIVAVERALKVPAADFRLWVCLHEVTHRVQFAQAPWMAELMRTAAADLGAAVDEPLGELAGRVVSAVRDLRTPGEKTMAQRGVLGLMRAVQAEPQREALDRLLALGTLLEGHADHVMDGVGPSVVPAVTRIRQAFDSRRRRSTNPIHRLMRTLLGMDAKMAQYVHGKKFVDTVVGRVGMVEFNAVWAGPDTMPTLTEIDDPDAWIARVLG